MSFTELHEAAKALPREEQLRLVDSLQESNAKPTEHALTDELTRDPALDFWSPIFAPESAKVMLEMLDEQKFQVQPRTP